MIPSKVQYCNKNFEATYVLFCNRIQNASDEYERIGYLKKGLEDMLLWAAYNGMNDPELLKKTKYYEICNSMISKYAELSKVFYESEKH